MPLSNRRPLDAATQSTLRGKQGLDERVRDQILAQITQGDVTAGQCFGTEGELAEMLGVGRNTLRKAIASLEREGYVSRRRGLGIVVERRPTLAGVGADRVGGPVDIASGERMPVIVQLPRWDDSEEGFYTGRFLKLLTRPHRRGLLAVEIRHYEDVLHFKDVAGRTVICVDPDPTRVHELLELDRHGVRVIVFAPYQPIPGLVAISPDRRPMVCELVKRLYAMGHAAVGLINNNPVHMSFQQAWIGFLDAHRELNRPIHPRAMVQVTALALDGGAVDVEQVTAWVCTYIGGIPLFAEACRVAGRSVPEDVSLVSLDDTGEAPAAHLGKAISVMVDDLEATVDLIRQFLVDYPDALRGKIQITPYRYIERETVAPPVVSARVSEQN